MGLDVICIALILAIGNTNLNRRLAQWLIGNAIEVPRLHIQNPPFVIQTEIR